MTAINLEKLIISLINLGFRSDILPTNTEHLIEALKEQGLEYNGNEIVPIISNPEPKKRAKFKPGDWVASTFNGNVHKIVKVAENKDYYEFDDGFACSIGIGNELYRPWGIRDANNGDILYAMDEDSNEWLVIYKSFDSILIRTHVSLCFWDNKLYLGNINGWSYLDNISVIHPASKEQKELLMQKLTENEFEWDAEKKILKENNNKEGMAEVTQNK